MNEVLSRGKRMVVRGRAPASRLRGISRVCVSCVQSSSPALAALVGGLIVGCRKCGDGLARVQARIAGGATLTTAMYAGVALKWLWFALAMYLAIARLKLDAAPLLIGIVVTQLGYWVGLVRLK